MPLGVAPTFIINNKHLVVPMATEEPSVIAAASSAGKLIAGAGGFIAHTTSNIMIGQVQIVDLDDVSVAFNLITEQRDELITIANEFCSSMATRGGGVINIEPRIVNQRNPTLTSSSDFLVVHIHMNVCDAMGANAINTVSEGLAPHLAKITSGRIGLRILSNMCLERRAATSFRIPFSHLAWKGLDGAIVAQRIVEAYEFAESDPFRAVTHNKGIMNGIDAVAIATGQDWRAIEAAAHAYACRHGYYGSITSYTIDGDALVGTLEMPIAVGTVGGSLKAHPMYKTNLKMLGSPNSQQLAQIIASVGLAQNFAALRALATEGIQKGHMQLHARKYRNDPIAIAA